MNRLSELCKASELHVNVEKTKVVIFKTRSNHAQLLLNDTKSESGVHQRYKYQGMDCPLFSRVGHYFGREDTTYQQHSL